MLNIMNNILRESIADIVNNKMKKILLLIFISLAFMSSANANSIKGGFGYKLGQSLPDLEITCNIIACGFILEYFKPVNQMPPFDDGNLETTIVEKKIHRISLWYDEDSTKDNSCFMQESWTYDKFDFTKIQSMLFAKYGPFERTWKRSKTSDGITYIFRDGARSVRLSCSWTYEKESLFKPYSGQMMLELEYKDDFLKKLAGKEASAYRKKIKLQEGSEYDF